jgi:hypothetical protein
VLGLATWRTVTCKALSKSQRRVSQKSYSQGSMKARTMWFRALSNPRLGKKRAFAKHSCVLRTTGGSPDSDKLDAELPCRDTVMIRDAEPLFAPSISAGRPSAVCVRLAEFAAEHDQSSTPIWSTSSSMPWFPDCMLRRYMEHPTTSSSWHRASLLMAPTSPSTSALQEPPDGLGNPSLHISA